MTPVLFKILFSGFACIFIFILLWVLPFNKPRVLLNVLLWVIGCGPIFAEIFGNRISSFFFQIDASNAYLYIVPNSTRDTIGTIVTYSSVFIAGFLIIYYFVKLDRTKSVINRQSFLVWMSILWLSLGPLLSSFGGTEGKFTVNLLIAPIIFTAVILSIPQNSTNFLVQIKTILSIYVYGSLLAIIFFFNWSMAPITSTLIPGFHYRLIGISSHPNSLGPLSGIFIFFELIRSSSKKWIHVVNLIAGFLILLLSQSKTALLGVLIALLWYLFFFQKPKTAKAQLLKVSLTLLFISILVVGFVTNLETIKNNFLNPAFSTLTGRTKIWSITLSFIKQNPLFGYGPGLWGIDFRQQFSMINIGQSHNQFIDTLGESGIFGFLGLMAYLLVISWISIFLCKKSHGLSGILLIITLARMVTETPFRNYAIDNSFFLHLIVVFVAITFINLSPLITQKKSEKVLTNKSLVYQQ